MEIHSFNPFSSQFHQAAVQFHSLSRPKQIIAVIAAIVGGILTPFILCTGSFALFQLSVKWLRKGENHQADKVDQVVKGRAVLSAESKENTTQTEEAVFELGTEGKKRLSLPNGDYFVGKFNGAIFTGTGRYTLKEGHVYEGEFVEGKLTGKGVINYSNGIVYQGRVNDFKRTGPGTLIFLDKSQLQCEFVEDKMVGKGMIILDTGVKVDVEFVDGKIRRI